ncbi:MAG: hypothetical protein K0Q68_2486 [Moraxellaceae bacterium]|jgi:hypothetical protein|nr:hypothetical protein [Moraxellaceae bacterium]
MKAARAWSWLAVAAGCAGLLVVLVVAVAVQGRDKPPAAALAVAGAPEGESRFPADFGRLDDLVPFAGGAAPVAEVVVAIEHAPEFRSADWVAAQNPEAWTIQAMAARDEEAVKRFLAGREDRADFSYFVFPLEGSDWFVVTLGSFPSRELAEGIAASKGLGGGGGQAFPRRLGVYQEALRPAMPAPSPAAEPAAPPRP